MGTASAPAMPRGGRGVRHLKALCALGWNRMEATCRDSRATAGLRRSSSTEAGASIGDVLEVQTGGESVRGTLVPRYEHDDDKHIVIKLKNGYNVGISVEKVSKVVRVAKGEAPKFVTAEKVASKGLPEVSILGTGGTIASRVDYRTGAVDPATTAEELYSLFPELSEIATITPEIVLSVYSENLEPEHWETIAKKVSEVVAKGVSGIILTMGTDTMGYTAAALSFALRGLPVPLFIVGSQRSSDRPSSDAFLNLIGAATMAVQADFSGVYVVMHADSSDERLASPFGDAGEEEPHEREGRVRVDGGRAGRLLVPAGDPGDGARGAAPAGRREGLRREAQVRPAGGAREVLPVDARRVPRRAPGLGAPRGRLRGDRAGAHQQQEHRAGEEVRRRRRGGLHDLPVPLGEGGHERLRHGEGPAQGGRRPSRGHAPRDRARQADVGLGELQVRPTRPRRSCGRTWPAR